MSAANLMRRLSRWLALKVESSMRRCGARVVPLFEEPTIRPATRYIATADIKQWTADIWRTALQCELSAVCCALSLCTLKMVGCSAVKLKEYSQDRYRLLALILSASV